LNTHLGSRAAKVLVFQQLKMKLPELFAESGILESRMKNSFTQSKESTTKGVVSKARK